MKAVGVLLSLCFAQTVLSQSLAPSPTASYGCEPHGDHWHCAGAKTATVSAAPTGADHDHDDHEHDDHDHDEAGTGSIAPSPIESEGCEPHGDHWHCAGPKTAAAVTQTGSSAAAPITSKSSSKTLAPSPTESAGCEPHGDHWHCAGPATGAASSTGAVSTGATTGSSSTPTAGAYANTVNGLAAVGVVLAAGAFAI